MCLSKSISWETGYCGLGWKAFSIIQGELYGIYYNFHFKYDTWIRDDEDTHIYFLNEQGWYDCGFHFFFESPSLVEGDVLLPIRYRELVVTGEDVSKTMVGVAKEIYIKKSEINVFKNSKFR